MTSFLKYLFYAILVLSLGSVIALGVYGYQHLNKPRPPVEQPVDMSHKFHIQTLGMKCEKCHQGARSEIHASIPTPRDCMACKTEMLEGTITAKKKKLEGLLKKEKEGKLTDREKAFLPFLRGKKELEFRPVYDLQGDIFFSHRRHVKVAKLECNECHGEVKEKEELAQYPRREILLMKTCMDCHKKKKASNDCLACHR